MSALNEVGPERPTNSVTNAIQRPTALPTAAPAVNAHVAAPSQVPVAAPQQARKIKENTTKIPVYFDIVPADINEDSVTKQIKLDAAHKVFKTDSKELPDLSKAIVTRMSITATKNDLPFGVKFGIHGSEPSNVTLDGHEADLFLTPGDNHRGLDTEIFNSKKAFDEAALERYGHTSLSSMLESITTIKGTSSVLVPMNHEIVRVLEKNVEKYGPAPSQKDVVDGHYKLDGNIVKKAIQDLHNAVLTRFNFTNLAEFKVTMQRMDNEKFSNHVGSIRDHLETAEAKECLKQRAYAGFELKIDWIVPPKENSASKSVVDNSVVQHYQPSASKIPVASPK